MNPKEKAYEYGLEGELSKIKLLRSSKTLGEALIGAFEGGNWRTAQYLVDKRGVKLDPKQLRHIGRNESGYYENMPRIRMLILCRQEYYLWMNYLEFSCFRNEVKGILKHNLPKEIIKIIKRFLPNFFNPYNA